ncbi:hypothetical protein DACRYDRAFT_20413 [Dacryopinax primogenitus]|uniref:Lytic polysaccharide monooxygenase n=1 Tax=Dacryopinax primogenitus (strain DJM 731) TaxID=1858805 RepID=M5G3J3_DACPD|nr:uncharacterized protein DACRYDRAFT_20413 [Dacryopinax primogenitus]EJU04796.1 hypothetical protein DACRYDRAFT_20413 [Dacryopinax primogenitus]
MLTSAALIAAVVTAVPAAAHLAPWHPSMYGFNWTLHNPGWANPGAYDNRPVVPLMGRTFDDWWMHGHIDLPPNPGDVLQVPAGGKFLLQMACDKGATDYYASSDGGDIRDGDWPCPNSTSDEWHTKDMTDIKGCGIGIAYKSDITQVTPEDITIFTVNVTCPWYRYQWFDVPADMPPCDNCICTFNWIHSPDDGSMQMYQNAYACQVTNSGPGKQLQTPQVARRCGYDPTTGTPAVPSNCTGGEAGGAKQGLYWLQADGNNMFEGYYDAPYYNPEYGFSDGAQTDIFVSDGAASTSSLSSDSSSPTSTAAADSGATTSAAAQPTDTSDPSSGSASSDSGAASPTSSTSMSSSTADSAAPTVTPAAGVADASNPGGSSCPARKRSALSGKKPKKAKKDGKKTGSGKSKKRNHNKKRAAAAATIH